MVRRGGSKKLFPRGGGVIFNKGIENISEIGGGLDKKEVEKNWGWGVLTLKETMKCKEIVSEFRLILNEIEQINELLFPWNHHTISFLIISGRIVN